MRWEFRMRYLEKIIKRYQAASKAAKTRILDELCKVCSYDRKYAIWKLGSWIRGVRKKGRLRRKREKKYNPEVLEIMEKIWEAANYPWSTRLKEIIRLWLPWVKKHFPLSQKQEQQLLAMSPSTMDRALKSKKHKMKRRLYGRTKPGTLLKHQIPIKTDCWDVEHPGFIEVDLVSHSGPDASGEFLHSVNLTDVLSGWVETRSVMGKGERGVVKALDEMRQELPFDVLAFDSDNGSEFINYHLKRYCDKAKIQMTRGRPYKKNDNAHIEQKNWTHVRRLLGWSRYDTPKAQEAMNDFYRNEYRMFMNFFQPSVRLQETVRKGSRVKRKYDLPRTPLDRLLDVEEKKLALQQKNEPCISRTNESAGAEQPKPCSKNVSEDAFSMKLSELKKRRESLDPFELSERVNQKLKRIWHLTHRAARAPKVRKGQTLTKVDQKTLHQLTKVFGLPFTRKQGGKGAPAAHG